ncbi:MAG: outer membrane beta-barrel protein [Candidatus Acidiferrum sp.]
MKKIPRLSLLVLLFAPAAYGQRALFAGAGPLMEVGLGYSNVEGNIPSQSRLGMNGAQAIFNADFHPRVGVKVDMGYVRNFNAFGSGRTADILTYMAGPVFYPVWKRRMNVYTHVLLGGARETGVNFQSNGEIVRGFANRVAWAGGAGFQYRLARMFAMRVGVDYLHTSFYNSSVALQGQNNVRSSISLIYSFGKNRE